jgi:hypothetical protein
VQQLESNNITTHSISKGNSKDIIRKNQTRDREKAEENSSRIPSKMLHDRPHLYTLRIILEHAKEWQSDVNIGFIDFEKAFDNVNREQMWRILRLYGISSKMIRMIKLFYDYKARVEHGKSTQIDKHRKRSKTRLRHVTHAVPYHHRLDNEKDNRQQNRNNMEIAEQIGRYRICRRCVFTNRKYAEEITETGGRRPKNRVKNKRQENHYIGK